MLSEYICLEQLATSSTEQVYAYACLSGELRDSLSFLSALLDLTVGVLVGRIKLQHSRILLYWRPAFHQNSLVFFFLSDLQFVECQVSDGLTDQL